LAVDAPPNILYMIQEPRLDSYNNIATAPFTGEWDQYRIGYFNGTQTPIQKTNRHYQMPVTPNKTNKQTKPARKLQLLDITNPHPLPLTIPPGFDESLIDLKNLAALRTDHTSNPFETNIKPNNIIRDAIRHDGINHRTKLGPHSLHNRPPGTIRRDTAHQFLGMP
jgi:hypothetical protein